MTDDDGEDVLADLEAELPPFLPETFGELVGVSYDPNDYERHSWSRRLRKADTAAPVRTDRRFCARFDCRLTRRSVRLWREHGKP